MEENEQIYLRKNPGDEPINGELFPDAMKPDGAFFALLKFNRVPVGDWKDADKAILELNYLKTKSKELAAKLDKIIEYITGLYTPVIAQCEENTNEINLNIVSYLNGVRDQLPVTEAKLEDGHRRRIKELENTTLTIDEKTSYKLTVRKLSA